MDTIYSFFCGVPSQPALISCERVEAEGENIQIIDFSQKGFVSAKHSEL